MAAHTHTPQTPPANTRWSVGSLLTNHCSSGSEWRQRLEGGGRVDEVERGTRETRHGVGQPLPPNIHTTCAPISTRMYVHVVSVLWAIQCDWQEQVLMCVRSKKCDTTAIHSTAILLILSQIENRHPFTQHTYKHWQVSWDHPSHLAPAINHAHSSAPGGEERGG